jgi:hypothetical protein
VQAPGGLTPACCPRASLLTRMPPGCVSTGIQSTTVQRAARLSGVTAAVTAAGTGMDGTNVMLVCGVDLVRPSGRVGMTRPLPVAGEYVPAGPPASALLEGPAPASSRNLNVWCPGCGGVVCGNGACGTASAAARRRRSREAWTTIADQLLPGCLSPSAPRPHGSCRLAPVRAEWTPASR